MAQFAEVNADNIVVKVLAVSNDVTTVDGVEDEQRGIDLLNELYPDSGTWVQTSVNTFGGVHLDSERNPDGGTPLRYNFAGPGFTWDGTGFIPPQPFPSWSLGADRTWQPPTPQPRGPITVELDGVAIDTFVPYLWDEDTTSWVQPSGSEE